VDVSFLQKETHFLLPLRAPAPSPLVSYTIYCTMDRFRKMQEVKRSKTFAALLKRSSCSDFMTLSAVAFFSFNSAERKVHSLAPSSFSLLLNLLKNLNEPN
jgi:hypothetical protein